MVLRKDQIEASLHEEKKLIGEGKLKEENPLDVSETFVRLCEACRRGDLKSCQETITEGANINARVRTFQGRLFMLGHIPSLYIHIRVVPCYSIPNLGPQDIVQEQNPGSTSGMCFTTPGFLRWKSNADLELSIGVRIFGVHISSIKPHIES